MPTLGMPSLLTSTFTEVHLIVDLESLQPRHETTKRVAQSATIPSAPYSVTIQNRRRPATSRAPQTLRRITSLAATSTPTQNRQTQQSVGELSFPSKPTFSFAYSSSMLFLQREPFATPHIQYSCSASIFLSHSKSFT